jgi:hypothetical protein
MDGILSFGEKNNKEGGKKVRRRKVRTGQEEPQPVEMRANSQRHRHTPPPKTGNRHFPLRTF